MEVQWKQSLEEKDYVAFGLYQVRKRLVFAWLLGTAFLFLYLNFISAGNVLFRILFALGFGLLTVFMMRRSISRQYAKSYQTSAMGLSTEIVVGDEGIFQTGEDSQMQVGYDQIFKVTESDTAFYVYLTALQAVLWVKRDFSSPEDVDTCRNILIEHLPPEKVKELKR